MANTRYQLKTSIHMPLDGQWGLVGAGTVFDDAQTISYTRDHVTVLAEPAAQLGSHGKATSVRNVSRL